MSEANVTHSSDMLQIERSDEKLKIGNEVSNQSKLNKNQIYYGFCSFRIEIKIFNQIN
jgi:putative cell wall-binding protein